MRIVLALIISIQIIFGVLYAYNTPHWEAPDEPAHFNYVRTLAETGAFPVLAAGDYDQAFLENIKAAKFPPTTPIDSIRYESYQPPFYYLLAAPIYLAAHAAGLDVVFALRLFSVALGAVLSLLTFQLLRRVFVANHLLALAGVGLIATVPMHIAMSAAINADTLAEVLLAALLLISIARVQGDMSDRRFVLLGGMVYGLALLTSTKIYASALLLILAEVGYRGWKLEARSWPLQGKMLRVLLPLLGLALLLSAWWFARNLVVYGGLDILGWTRHDAVVVGQPTTAEWVARYGFKNIVADFFIITFKSFWAQFGWMGVLVNDRIYVALFVLTALASFGALLWTIRLVRTRAEFAKGILWSWLILGVLLGIILLAHAWYNLRFVQPQGRYLFPALIPLAALWVAGIYELFEKRYVALVFVMLYLVMLGLDYISLFWFIVPQLST